MRPVTGEIFEIVSTFWSLLLVGVWLESNNAIAAVRFTPLSCDFVTETFTFAIGAEAMNVAGDETVDDVVKESLFLMTVTASTKIDHSRNGL